jgi:hypothetical protein
MQFAAFNTNAILDQQQLGFGKDKETSTETINIFRTVTSRQKSCKRAIVVLYDFL